MKARFGVGNRVTIPRDLYSKLGWQIGQDLECNIIDGKLVLSSVSVVDSKEPKVGSKNTQEKQPIIVVDNTNKQSHNFDRKIVSNLEQGLTFSKQKYSLCKLVIRTKPKYLRDFCKDCKGQLATEYNKESTCPYTNSSLDKDLLEYRSKGVKKDQSIENNKENTIKNTPAKQIIRELVQNIDRVNNKIDTQISNIENDTKIKSDNYDKLLEEVKQESKKSIVPVTLEHTLARCNVCKEQLDKGYFVNGKIFCSNCIKNDFKKFFKKYKLVKERRIELDV